MSAKGEACNIRTAALTEALYGRMNAAVGGLQSLGLLWIDWYVRKALRCVDEPAQRLPYTQKGMAGTCAWSEQQCMLCTARALAARLDA